MKIYDNEIKAGLQNILSSKNSIEVCASLKFPTEIENKIVEAGHKYFKYDSDKEYIKEWLSIDLMKIYCILVSTNWNKNDDVFSVEETYKAYQTPLYKPVNLNHAGRETTKNTILGVINNCFLMDKDYNDIYLDKKDMPDFFHLGVGAFLWEAYFPKIIKEIKEKIQDDKIFVSMECIFADFGYALRKDVDSPIQFLPRNDVTSKLTSNLRAYGGKGRVKIDGEQYLIGRWLKDFVFSGMGIVETPANPESIIFTDFLSHTDDTLPDKFKKIDEASIGEFDGNCNKNLENGVLSYSLDEIGLWDTNHV